MAQIILSGLARVIGWALWFAPAYYALTFIAIFIGIILRLSRRGNNGR